MLRTDTNIRDRSNEWTWIAAAWYIGGSCLFHAEATFGKGHWNETYYLWSAIKDLLLFVALCEISKEWCDLYPVLVYSTVRLWTEVQITVWPWQDINTKGTVTILFLLSLGALIHITLKDLIRQWNRVY